MISESGAVGSGDARYTIETDDGNLVYVSNIGIRHAPPSVMRRLNAGEEVDQSQIYFRAVPRFETDAPDLEWLMKHIFIATGERYPNGKSGSGAYSDYRLLSGPGETVAAVAPRESPSSRLFLFTEKLSKRDDLAVG